MRYVYCTECKEPISARSTFEESVIRGVKHKKKLKDTCGKSTVYCMECYLKLKKQFNKLECDCKTCRLMKDGFCSKLKQVGK